MKKSYALVATIVVALVLTGSALAGGSMVTSYGGQAQQALVKTNSVSKSTTKSAQAQKPKESSALPFTGMDVGVILAIGGAMVLTGLALRRSARRQS